MVTYTCICIYIYTYKYIYMWDMISNILANSFLHQRLTNPQDRWRSMRLTHRPHEASWYILTYCDILWHCESSAFICIHFVFILHLACANGAVLTSLEITFVALRSAVAKMQICSQLRQRRQSPDCDYLAIASGFAMSLCGDFLKAVGSCLTFPTGSMQIDVLQQRWYIGIHGKMAHRNQVH
jgi:hypothetical protein